MMLGFWCTIIKQVKRHAWYRNHSFRIIWLNRVIMNDFFLSTVYGFIVSKWLHLELHVKCKLYYNHPLNHILEWGTKVVGLEWFQVV